MTRQKRKETHVRRNVNKKLVLDSNWSYANEIIWFEEVMWEKKKIEPRPRIFFLQTVRQWRGFPVSWLVG